MLRGPGQCVDKMIEDTKKKCEKPQATLRQINKQRKQCSRCLQKQVESVSVSNS